jgi:hypothetical protein
MRGPKRLRQQFGKVDPTRQLLQLRGGQEHLLNLEE